MFILTIILLFIGIIFMYGASYISSQKIFNIPSYFLTRHVVYTLIGITMLLITWRTPIDFIFKLSNLLLLFSFFSLILVLIIGSDQKGSKRWISLFIFNFQPSEISKIIIIIFLSSFYNKKTSIHINKSFSKSLIIIYLISFLIFIEFDFSTSFVLFSTSVFLLFISGGPIRYVFYPFSSIPLLYLLTKYFPYMNIRVNYYLSKLLFNKNLLYQEKQVYKILFNANLIEDNIGISKIPIPESHTDFFFISIISQAGFLFGISLLFFLLYYYFFLFKVANHVKKITSNNKYATLIYGISFLLIWQTIINISSNLGIIPITGIPLPFLSFGGNSIITCCFGIGLILSCLRYSFYDKAKKTIFI